MRIYELEKGQAFRILIIIGNQNMEFESEVLETVPLKHMILAKPVIKNDKILTFNGKGISANVVLPGKKDTKPLVFRNAVFSTVKAADGKLRYAIVSNAEAVEFNRRDSFRCSIDVPSVAKIGLDKETHNIILRDVSVNGFSFCFF